MSELNVAVDVDGVCRNIFTGIANAYLLHGGHKYFKLSEFKDYDFTKMMPLIMNKEKFFRDYAETIFLNARTMPFTHEINRLKEYGKLQIVTSQFKGLEDLTLWWLDKHHIDYDEVHFTWDKSSVNTDILLDDYPKNLESMPQNVIKVCYDAPYNHHWTGNRVRNMREFVNLVSKLGENNEFN